MSVCVTIRTGNRPEPEDVFKALVETGERIIVTSAEYPCVKFGVYNEALRGIELNEEDDGVEVRVCSFASAEDYRLFAKTVKTVMDLTGGKAFYENDDEDEVTDPIARFDEQWSSSERLSGLDIHRIFSLRYGKVITIYGFFSEICIGPRLLKGFDIDLDSQLTIEDADALQEYLVSVQWYLDNKQDTSTHMILNDPDAPEGAGKSISMIIVKDGKVSDFDYISYADIFAMMDLDCKDADSVLVPFEEITKIIPDEGFRILDEYQFERTEELTVESFRQIMERARIFQRDDLLHKVVKPGEGYDEMQNTVILMWNPAISSMKMEDFIESIPDVFTEEYSWSVWEHERAKCGDRFFMVRCGDGKTGIVMSGVFDSQPYESEDWSGRGRRTFYMEMTPNVILNPDKAPMLTTAELEEAIPGFQWSGGHSGRILPKEDAKTLEKLWREYLRKNLDAIDGKTISAAGQFEQM